MCQLLKTLLLMLLLPALFTAGDGGDSTTGKLHNGNHLNPNQPNETDTPSINKKGHYAHLNESLLNLTAAVSGLGCKIRPLDDHTYNTIYKLLNYQHAKLLEYHISIVNHTSNPLLLNEQLTYKLNQWARVGHSHGTTILSLAFNYGVLSLMTLTFGVAVVDVDLLEEPYGCLQTLEEFEKVDLLIDLLLRDFKPGPKVKLNEGACVCHQVG